MTLNEACDELVGKLEADGWRVTIDPRDVNPPCLVVGLPGSPAELTRRTACSLAGGITVTAVAPPPGNADARRYLLDVVDALMFVLPGATAAPSSFTPAGASTELPAYTLTLTLTT